MGWTEAPFEVAMPWGAHKVTGLTRGGLGIWQVVPPWKRKIRPLWSLSHLNSGHAVAHLSGTLDEVLPVATAVGDIGDWDFLSMHGWKDRIPDVKERIADLIDANPRVLKPAMSSGGTSEATARTISLNRC